MTNTAETTVGRATHVAASRPLMQPQALAVHGVRFVPAVILGLLGLLLIL